MACSWGVLAREWTPGEGQLGRSASGLGWADKYVCTDSWKATQSTHPLPPTHSVTIYHMAPRAGTGLDATTRRNRAGDGEQAGTDGLTRKGQEPGQARAPGQGCEGGWRSHAHTYTRVHMHARVHAVVPDGLRGSGHPLPPRLPLRLAGAPYMSEVRPAAGVGVSWATIAGKSVPGSGNSLCEACRRGSVL